MSTTAPILCDCLNDCGDDPWLSDGRALPCERRKLQLARDQVLAEQATRVNEIAKHYGAATMSDLIEHLHAEVTKLKAMVNP